MKRCGETCALLLVALAATEALGQIIRESQWGGGNLPPIRRNVATDDLIAGKDIIINGGAAFESGYVDPAHGVEAFRFNSTDCLEIWYDEPLPGFYHALGDPSPEANMPLLTDGAADFGAVLADFARASGVFRYDFATPTDIGEIWVRARNAGRDIRVMQHYDVYYSTDNGANYAPLMLGVISGGLGSATGYQFTTTLTGICDPTSNVIAEDVTNLRFVFYAPGYGDVIFDPWRGYANEGSSFYTVVCPSQYPAEPQDLDGKKQSFVGSIIDEIDVLAPTAKLAGDGDADGDVDLADVTLFVERCIQGPESAGPADMGCTCPVYDFDLSGTYDLRDYAGLQEVLAAP